MRRSAAVWLGFTGVLLAAGCADGSASRADAVAAITVDAVPARYASFAHAAAELDGAVESWCATGDGKQLTRQVEATRLAWTFVSPFWFGPVMDRRSRFIIDPTVSADDIGEILDGTQFLDATTLRERYGADQRGLAAIEVLVDVAGESAPAERVCDYAHAVAELVGEEAGELSVAWRDAGPEFAADDGAANAALEAMVNEVLFGVVTIANDPASDVARSRLAGMRWAILGDPLESTGNIEGISGLLDDDVVEQLDVEFDEAISLAPDAVRNLELTITTNVVSALGLSVQFSDADGDG